MDRAIIVDSNNQCSYYYPYEVSLEDGELEVAIKFANAMILLYRVEKTGNTYVLEGSKSSYEKIVQNISKDPTCFPDKSYKDASYPIYSIVTRDGSDFVEKVTISVCALPSISTRVVDRYRIFIDQGDYHMGCCTYHESTKMGRKLKALYDSMVEKYSIQDVVEVERKGLGEVLFGEVS